MIQAPLPDTRTTPRQLLPHLALPLGLLLSLIHHLRALDAIPLEAIDRGGAEYIPHIQRLLAEGLMPFDPWPPWRLLIQLDGHYGGLLHAIAALWGSLGPGAAQASALPWASHLSWLALALIALAVQTMGRRLMSDPWAGPLGGIVALTLPGLTFPAQRYYYDLPMTAALAGAALFLLTPKVQGIPSLMLGALLGAFALLFKWAAGLYLLPLGLLYIHRTWGEARLPTRLALGLAIPLLLTAPLLLKSDGSAAFQLGLLGPQGPLGGGMPIAGRAMAYGSAWILDGMGPIPFVVALISALWATPGPRLAIGVGILLPTLLLTLGLPIADGRYLMPLLPPAALLGGIGLSGLLHSKGGWTLGIPLGALALHTLWALGALAPPEPQAVKGAWGALRPERHWWYGTPRDREPAPIDRDRGLAEAILPHCQGGTLILQRPRPHDLPIHPLRYWLDALGGDIDLRTRPPEATADPSRPLCTLRPKGLPLVQAPSQPPVDIPLEGRGGAPLILTLEGPR